MFGMQREHNAAIYNDPAMLSLQWNAALDDAAMIDAVDQLPYIKVSILMCAFNEQRTIGRAVRDVLAVDYPCEVELIVVDDGSIDATASIVAKFDDPRLIFHKHEKNKGKGAALRTAASLASGTHLLPFDADLEYQPKDIPRLIEPIMTGRFEVVYGARLFGYNTVYHSFRYAVGNKVLTTLMNILFDAYLSDMHTCLKLMPVDTFNNLKLRENGFGLDTEITAALLRLGIRPFEVPVSYYSRSHAEGKKINVWDALECLHILFKVRTKRKKGLTLPALKAGGADRIALPAVDESSTSADLADVDALEAAEAADPVTPETGAVAAG
jgi:dolichol-phosphate hexosyltransferase